MGPQEIYDNFHKAPGPGALTAAQQNADGLSQSYPEHARDVAGVGGCHAVRVDW